MSPANRLRALIAGQFIWVALTGVAARAERWGPTPWAAYWFLVAAVICLWPMLFGLPILAWWLARWAGLPGWKLWLIAGIEAALSFALLLAMLPAFQ